MTTQQDSGLPAASTQLRTPTSAAISDGENVFRALADQARSRSVAGLWTTAIGGAVNAGLVWWQYPALSWLTAGFVATAAYGGWGLLDRVIAARQSQQTNAGAPSDALAEVRGLIAVIGTGAVAWAVLGFMAAALGSLR